MRAAAFIAMVVLTVTCGPSPDAKLPGYVSSNGGSIAPSQGGATESGGATGSGGVVSTGGTTVVASGGKTGTGGGTASGGSNSAGGVSGSGGSVSTGSGGKPASGGASGSGGNTSADAGRPSIDGGGSCVSKIISNGYACGTATACSECKDNGTSLEAKCKAVLDCFESKYPCTGNCSTECFNSAGASGPVQACVTGLTAACSSGGC
jgi:hypothetical protein